MRPVIVEHRRTLWSELSEIRELPAGLTVAEIVATLLTPVEFSRFGAVYIKAGPQDRGHVLERCYWHRIRPKPGTALFVSCVPHGGDGKNVFATIAAIALIALTVWVGAGGLGSLFNAAFLGAGTTGAYLASAAVAVAGPAVLQPIGVDAGGGSTSGAPA
jgi:hypothetical protein